MILLFKRESLNWLTTFITYILSDTVAPFKWSDTAIYLRHRDAHFVGFVVKANIEDLTRRCKCNCNLIKSSFKLKWRANKTHKVFIFFNQYLFTIFLLSHLFAYQLILYNTYIFLRKMELKFIGQTQSSLW
jgi:hypothetical protein